MAAPVATATAPHAANLFAASTAENHQAYKNLVQKAAAHTGSDPLTLDTSELNLVKNLPSYHDLNVNAGAEAVKTAGKSEASQAGEPKHHWIGISAAAVIGLAGGSLIVYLICHSKNKKLKAQLAAASAQGG